MTALPLINTPRIIPRIFGGIGNQLFIYATARRLALVNNAELILDDVSGFARDYDYQRCYQLDNFNIPCRKTTAAERLEPFSQVRRYLKRTVNKYRPFENRRYIQQESVDFDQRILNIKPRGKVYLEGYWQSENYFKDVESVIRQELKIQSPLDSLNLTVARNILGHTAVAVHVRFFDKPWSKGVNNIAAEYYKQAIDKIEKHIPDAHYYLFSNQPETAKDFLPLPETRVTLVTHNQGDSLAYADLWLMSQCKHFIIANSTFSWWGAWLASYKDKYVVAPGGEIKQGVMSWGFKGLLPENWIQIK